MKKEDEGTKQKSTDDSKRAEFEQESCPTSLFRMRRGREERDNSAASPLTILYTHFRVRTNGGC